MTLSNRTTGYVLGGAGVVTGWACAMPTTYARWISGRVGATETAITLLVYILPAALILASAYWYRRRDQQRQA